MNTLLQNKNNDWRRIRIKLCVKGQLGIKSYPEAASPSRVVTIIKKNFL